jgi:phosphatidylglycerol:prolipoprotein diacylglycerol transferase
MFPILLNIGPVTLHTYGLLVAVAFLVGYHTLRDHMSRHNLPLTLADGLAFALLLGGIVGARIAYFLVSEPALLWKQPWSLLRVWEGGLVFYGGAVAGVIVAAIYARVAGYPFFRITDSLVAPLLIAHAIGRLGCFFAGCCYGRPTGMPWSVTFSRAESLAPIGVPLHPTQLYEFLADLLLFFGARALDRREPRKGVLTAYYLMAYGAARFVLEMWRGDDRGFLLNAAISPSQWISLAGMAAGLGVLAYVVRSPKT